LALAAELSSKQSVCAIGRYESSLNSVSASALQWRISAHHFGFKVIVVIAVLFLVLSNFLQTLRLLSIDDFALNFLVVNLCLLLGLNLNFKNH